MVRPRTTTIGVADRAYERAAMKLSLLGRFVRTSTKIIDALCERCSTSGKCICDVYDRFICESNAACDLGCPGYCELLAHLESLQGDTSVPSCDSVSLG